MGLDGELEPQMNKTVSNWDKLKLYAQVLKDQNSGREDLSYDNDSVDV